MREGHRAVVTGGAGFIGSNLVDRLIGKGLKVKVLDNLSTGKIEYLEKALDSGRATLVKADLKKSSEEWVKEFKGADVVYHLAANPEVRTSISNPRIHFEENIVSTFNVLEACRINDVPLLIFASSSTVYGDAKIFPTPEDYHPLEPISVYGAAKLASENLITTYSRLYGIKAAIFRFANIVGPRQSHGVIVDFIKKLKKNSKTLEILGDGTQKKSYLHVDDLLHGMDLGANYVASSKLHDVFNLGNKDWITVTEIANIVVEELGLKDVKYVYKPATPDGRGWVGDVKFMLLDISKITSLGWSPKMSSEEALRKTVKWLLINKIV